MKLPEDLGKKLDTIRWRVDIGNEATRLACFEAIVRDCAAITSNIVCDRHLPTGINIYGHVAARAILKRYGLESTK